MLARVFSCAVIGLESVFHLLAAAGHGLAIVGWFEQDQEKVSSISKVFSNPVGSTWSSSLVCLHAVAR